MLIRILITGFVLVAALCADAKAQFGGFAAPLTLGSGGNAPHSLAIADVDGDGDNDILINNQNSNGSIHLLRNLGGGSFAAATPTTINLFGAVDIAAGRLDADADIDFILVNSGGSFGVTVGLNQGNGNFSPGQSLPSFGQCTSIALGDFDGDGDLDFVVGRQNSTTITFRLNDGTGQFSGGASLEAAPAGSNAAEIVSTGDLNHDGLADIVVTLRIANQVAVFLATGSGNFAPVVRYTVGSAPAAVVIADLDGDLDSDIAVYNSTSPGVGVLLNDGFGAFTLGASAQSSSPGNSGGPRQLGAADLDSDGDIDLVLSLGQTSALDLFLNAGNATFARQSTPGVSGAQFFSLALGELWGDGSPDVAVANRVTAGDVRLFRNLTPFVAPGVFNLLSPGNNSTNVMPATSTFAWSLAAGFQVSYTLRIATEPTFAAPVFTSAALTGTSLPMPAGSLMSGARYYWDVTAVNPIGPTAASNAPFSFVTPIIGDVDGDGDVDFQDLNLVLSNYGAHP